MGQWLNCTVLQGRTQPAARLSERDLIALMEQHNIGTDATVAEHIQKQLDRGYATKDGNMTFWPTSLGEALVGAYRKMGLENLWLPNLRCASVTVLGSLFAITC
jgi:DNA topoisomerase-3